MVSTCVMPHYIILWSWSEKGIENVKDSSNRADQFKKTLENKGGRLVSIYWTFGQYDGVAIVETPDDATLMSALLSMESGGNVRTATLKAFTYEEVSKIIGNLS
jgi:uncharacterized protein with GYD domain